MKTVLLGKKEILYNNNENNNKNRFLGKKRGELNSNDNNNSNAITMIIMTTKVIVFIPVFILIKLTII